MKAARRPRTAPTADAEHAVEVADADRALLEKAVRRSLERIARLAERGAPPPPLWAVQLARGGQAATANELFEEDEGFWDAERGAPDLDAMWSAVEAVEDGTVQIMAHTAYDDQLARAGGTYPHCKLARFEAMCEFGKLLSAFAADRGFSLFVKVARPWAMGMDGHVYRFDPSDASLARAVMGGDSFQLLATARPPTA